MALSSIGIVTSVQTLLLMPLTGLALGQQPLISYNYGAKNMKRVKETLCYAAIGASIISVTGFACVQLFTSAIVHAFNNQTNVVTLSIHAMHIWFFFFAVVGAQTIMANYFQAIGKITESSFLNLLRQIILLIPLILILPLLFGLVGIFMAVPCADLCAFIITAMFKNRVS